MFNPFAVIRAAFDRSHLLGGVDDSPADRQFIRATELPDDPDTLVRAGIIELWRVSADGEPWFRAVDAASLDDWAPSTCRIIHDDDPGADFDPEADYYDADFEDPDTDPFAGLPDDDDYPDGYPEAWKAPR